MLKTVKFLTLTLFAAFLWCANLHAQSDAYSSYSPYTIYGIGDLNKAGTAYNKSMGGVGIAARNKRYINIMNPAAVTARDSLSFMADFGVDQNNVYYRQGDFKSANNTFNVCNFVLSVPIWRSSACMVGVKPFSSLGYDFSSVEEDKSIIGYTNNIKYNSYGEGGLTEIFFAAGATFFKRVSIGAQFNYYFGNLNKVTNMVYSDNTYRSMYGGYDMALKGMTGKFGLQYEQKLGREYSLTLGATYRMKTNIKGNLTDYSYASLSEVTDTLRHNVDTLGLSQGLNLAGEIAVGLTFKKSEQLAIEFDYIRSDWTKSNFSNVKGFAVNGGSGTRFTPSIYESFRLGAEFVPNRNDIRYYYKRIAYRVGAYYNKEYYQVDGNGINSEGITLGVTLPVFRWYNGVTLGADFGQRGSLKNNLVRERYFKFSIGVNIHDIWFQRHQYK